MRRARLVPRGVRRMLTVRRSGSLPVAAGDQRTEPVSRRATLTITAAVVLTAVVLVVDAIVSLASQAYLNLGSGVWLALAYDTVADVFYRPLWDGHAYGGTRYFPLLPVITALLAGLGIPIVPAGLAVSMAGLVALAGAVLFLLRRLAVPRVLSALGAALAVAPYFVHQTAFAVRSEPLSAAFAIAGLAVIAPLDARATTSRRIVLAATLFVCAFATKMTCAYAPAAAVAALLVSGHRTVAVKLAGATLAGAVLVLAATNLASAGRALESFRACALAGSTVGSFLTSTVVTRPLLLIGTSHLLTATFLLTAVGLIARPRDWLRLPALYLFAAAAVTAIIFTSPGTILTSQIVDVYVAAVVVMTVLTANHAGRLRDIGSVALVGLTLWAAGQNIARLAAMTSENVVRVSAVERARLIEAVRACDGPVISESPLVPILADQRPILLDPFSFHVLVQNRPELGADLVGRIARREFACVVLEQDPASERGRAWYRHVNLTGPVADAVLEHYRFDRTVAGQRFYLR